MICMHTGRARLQGEAGCVCECKIEFHMLKSEFFFLFGENIQTQELIQRSNV